MEKAFHAPICELGVPSKFCVCALETILEDGFGAVVDVEFVVVHECLLALRLLGLQLLDLLLQLAHRNQLDELPDARQEDEGGHAHQKGEEHNRQNVLLHFGSSQGRCLASCLSTFD